MNEKTQKEIFKFFAKNKIENFVGVPDSTLKYFIAEGIKHEKIGRIQPKLLKNLELENRVLNEKSWKKDCKWALEKMKKNTPVALIIRREFLD